MTAHASQLLPRLACGLLLAWLVGLAGLAASASRAAAAPASSPAAAPTPTPAPVSSPASAASAASIASGASTSPARPAASAPGISLPPSPACVPDPAAPDRCGPLTLERDPVTLPNATSGRSYARAIRAEGGLPPYRFGLLQGSLPSGLTLNTQGLVSGTPEQAGSSRFRVRVADSTGEVASQTYSLRVFAPATPAAKPASAPASAPAAQLSKLDLAQAGTPAHAAPTARVYQLEAAQLDALKAAVKPADAEPAPPADADSTPESPPDTAAPTPHPPANLAWSDAQQAQLEALLKPVMAVEYPTQSLFEAAVDAQVCAQAWQLIVQEAQRLKQQPPGEAAFADLCAASLKPGTDKVAAKAPARPASAASAAAVAWSDLPAWLMPPSLRPWLVEAAARDRPLQPAKPLQWTATPSCNCAAPRLQQPLYAIYPTWLADGPQPQTFDFSLINRISYFTLPLSDELTPVQPDAWTEAQTAFIRTARAYETRVDFTLYRADWRFLATEPATARDALIRRFTTEVPHQARKLLDTPLPGLASRAKAWLPGFREVQYMGDGLTVFFDQLPDPEREPVLAARFADFFPRFVKGLAQAMAQNRERRYAINLVLTDRQIGNQAGPFEVARLFDLLKAVEDPEMADGRIVETNSDYKRNSNIELRYLVLLSEPTSQSKRTLRQTIEASPALHGGDRRIFLRSVVPLLLLPQASATQYRDDIVYLQDNFGGAGFWSAPLIGQQFDAEQQKALRTTFGPEPGTGVSDALCSIVCPNRWLFRLAFELLLLIGLVCWALLQWNCEWRARYGRYALLGGVPPVLVGAALLQCDPALAPLRQSNAQLIALVTIPLLAALWALLKRKEDKP